VKKIAALSALAIMATAGASMGQTLTSRFLIQSATGSGAGYTVSTTSTAPASINMNVGDKIRITLQYQLSSPGSPFARGLASGVFQIAQSGAGAGTFERSTLVGSFLDDTAEASKNSGVHGVFSYPQAGEAKNVNGAFTETFVAHGLHGPYREGINVEGADDQSSVNGAITPTSLTIAAINLFNAGAYPANGNGRWYGVYSFDFTATTGGLINLNTSILPADANTLFKYWRQGSNQPQNSNLQGDQAALQINVAGGNTAPTIAEVSPINGSPNFTPVPDINNVLIATVTDAEGILASQVMAMLNTGTPDNLGSLVFSTNQVDANTVQVFMSYEIVNSDLAGGPKQFTVKINANDGSAAADQKIVTVNLVPAPGAAALLGLGGLIAARRRRA
jgi:hypothetical protein